MINTELSTVIKPFLQQLINFIANLLVALVVFVIGYFISVGIGKLISEILKSIKFNNLFEKEGWRRALQRANIEVDPAEFVGSIFKWVFVVFSLFIAVNALNLTSFTTILTQVLNYLPNIVVAVLALIVAIIISDIVEKLVRATVERLRVGYGHITASIVKWAIWVFTIFLVLDLVLPRSLLIKTFYTAIVYGVVGAIALGTGLAIGLGGKDVAGKVIDDFYKKTKEK